MRKFYLLAIGVVTLGLTSCLKGTDYKPSPVAPGLQLYSIVSTQNTISLDPANIAFRFNTLWYELKNTEQANATFENLKVKVKNGDNDVEVLLKNKLFGGAKITENPAGSGVFEIDFSRYETPANDYAHEGSVTIITDNKLLSEINERGGTWNIRNTPDKKKLSIVSGSTSFEIDLTNGYQIGGYGVNEWSITANSFVCSNTQNNNDNLKSSWSFYYTFAQGTGSAKYAEMSKSVYKLNCQYAEGKPVNAGVTFSYSTYSDLLLKADCRTPTSVTTPMYGGTEEVECTDMSLNTTTFPSPSVTVQWKQVEGDNNSCKASVEVRYNGQVEIM